MTIDELIERLRYDRELDMYINDLAEPIAELLEELKWYREQDLIRREDLIEELIRCVEQDKDFDMYEIPKAEPPHHIGEVTEMVNGDCETCNKYEMHADKLGAEVCKICIENNFSKYEPYIPKE